MPNYKDGNKVDYLSRIGGERRRGYKWERRRTGEIGREKERNAETGRPAVL